ncbi:Dynein light chain [Pichia californica]|nr:Dynein light chain [[Candida] californica]
MTELILKNSDMSEADQAKIFEITKSLYETMKNKQTDLALALKGKLDEELGGPWHVIVGKSFSSSVSHEKHGFIYFYIDNFAFLFFRTA